ncbi:MAG: hypothetical protein AAF846_25550 [Chloroflexota bacterium]
MTQVDNSNLWDETQPIHHSDPNEAYLMTAYRQVEASLHSVLPPIDRPITHSIAHIANVLHDSNNQATKLSTLLNHDSQQTLVLAEEGGGKTFTMLTLLRGAIRRRLSDPTAPLPIYAKARRWNIHKAPPLVSWLSAQSGLNATAIAEAIDSGTALLIIDGLDDLLQKYPKSPKSDFDPRDPFMEMLPDNTPIILSTAPNDPLATTLEDAHIFTLQRLTTTQIEAYLTSVPIVQPIWEAIQEQAIVMQVISKPFFLNMLIVAYKNTPDALSDLANKDEGEIRDAIFQKYVEARYQQAIAEHETRFRLQQVFDILGLVATKGVIRYGTGRVAMVEVNQPHWDDMLIVDDLRFGFIGSSSPDSADFMAFAQTMNLVTPPLDGIGSCTFVHPIIRDLMVVRHCFPIETKLTSYTIESLTRISDPRKYEAFAEVLEGDYKLNFKLQAFSALDGDSSTQATTTMQALAQTLQHDFFAGRIRDSLSKRIVNH